MKILPLEDAGRMTGQIFGTDLFCVLRRVHAGGGGMQGSFVWRSGPFDRYDGHERG